MPQRSNRDRTTPQQSNDQPGEHRKSRKESRRFTKPPIPPGTIDDKNVVNLSSKTLSINHLTLLNKGLTFCPTPYNNHPCHDLRDILLFNRRVRLTHHFNCETQTISPTSRDHFHRFKQSSGWTPPPGKDPFIDSFTSNLTSNFVNRTSPTHTGSNLTQGELDTLKDLKLDTDLVIKSADKGGAIVLQNRQDYLKEGLRQLSNVNHYERSTTTLFDASSKKIKIYLTNLVKANYLPSNAHLNLTYKNPRLPSLYLLPKIHKAGNPGRPIISACGGPTEKISSFVDSILKPFVTALPSHVKDTTHFLNLIHDLHLPTNHTLMTIDVSSLYTNIPHNEGLEACKELLLTRTVEDPPTKFVVTLIRFILTLNYFEFNDTVYHQVSGTAMGTKMAPNYANIFMGHLEKQLLNLHPVKPTLWLRYIDDIFCIYPGNENEANNFLLFLNSYHHSIKFTADISNHSVNFLDVTVLVNDQGKLTTTVYRKPTDTYRPKQHSMWAPVGPRLGQVGPQLGPGWARLGPIWECCLGVPPLQILSPQTSEKSDPLQSIRESTPCMQSKKRLHPKYRQHDSSVSNQRIPHETIDYCQIQSCPDRPLYPTRPTTNSHHRKKHPVDHHIRPQSPHCINQTQ